MKQGRMEVFLESFSMPERVFLEELRKKEEAEDIPTIRRSVQEFLKVLLGILKPESILEIGTAVGYSALFMAEYVPESCSITTIENYEKRIPFARKNFQQGGREEQITLLVGDAGECLDKLAKQGKRYNFVFLDGPKGQYLSYLPDIVSMLSAGGVLVSDNILQEGEILESRFLLERRQRTIHKRLREYLYELTHHDKLSTAIIPLGDGITVSVKKEADQG